MLETNFSQITPVTFDNTSMVIQGTVNGTPLYAHVTGNVSVINQQVGGDLIIEMQILQTLCLMGILYFEIKRSIPKPKEKGEY